jgi:hypothetical protein
LRGLTRRDTPVAAIVVLLVTTGLSLRADRIDLHPYVLFWLRDAIFGARRASSFSS